MKISLKLALASLAPLFFSAFVLPAACANEQLPPPSDQPPQIENLIEEEPSVTIKKKERVQQTTQTIQNGEQTEVKVTNELGTYIVKPNQTVGTSVPGDTQSSSNHPVQWIVKSWGGSQSTDPNEAQPAPPVLPNNPDSPTNE